MAILVKNGSERLIKEIWSLKKENKPLLKLLLDLRTFCKENYNKDITVTMIYRTQEEQDEIYEGFIKNNGREYDKDPWKSPHQFWHALDLRVSNFTDEEVDDIIEFIEYKYGEANFYQFTAINHDVGHGSHFHINYYEV